MKMKLNYVFMYLLALLSSYLERETISWIEVYIVVKDATKVDEIVCVDRWYGVNNFFLQFSELVFMY